MEVEFELENGHAAFEVTHYAAGRLARGWDPPEPTEVELDDMGEFVHEDGTRSAFSHDDLVEAIAAYHGINHEAAKYKILEDAVEQIVEHLESDFDDRGE